MVCVLAPATCGCRAVGHALGPSQRAISTKSLRGGSHSLKKPTGTQTRNKRETCQQSHEVDVSRPSRDRENSDQRGTVGAGLIDGKSAVDMHTEVSDISGKHRVLTGTCASASVAPANASAAQNQNLPFILMTSCRFVVATDAVPAAPKQGTARTCLGWRKTRHGPKQSGGVGFTLL